VSLWPPWNYARPNVLRTSMKSSTEGTGVATVLIVEDDTQVRVLENPSYKRLGTHLSLQAP
jgi:hypothetical protein